MLGLWLTVLPFLEVIKSVLGLVLGNTTLAVTLVDPPPHTSMEKEFSFSSSL